MKDSDGDKNVLNLVHISINVLVVNCTTVLQDDAIRKKTDKGIWNLYIISYNCMGIYNFLRINS